MRLLILLALLFARSSGVGGGPLFAQVERPEQNSDAVRHEKGSAKGSDIDRELFKKVRPLYPHVLIDRTELRSEESGKPYFSLVKEIARVRAPDGKERLVVLVGWIVPAARVNHGGGELLIYEDAKDKLPLIRKSTFGLPPLRLINNRWLQFGTHGILLSLVDKDALVHFDRQGEGVLICGLAREEARRALEVYLREGREAFLKRASIRGEPWRVKNLPERIGRFEFYPSLVEESRYSFFKYYDSWEATLLVQLTPGNATEQPVVLEMGVRGLTGGIEAGEAELLLWETRLEEPTDRPDSAELGLRLRY